MKNKKLIIFDWDGTLMDSVPKIINSVKLLADKHQLACPSDNAASQIIGLSLDIALQTLFPKSTQIDLLVESYKEIYLHIDNTSAPLFANVKRCLTQLKNKGYLLAVATGKSREGLDRLMLDTELMPLFSATRTASECESKPSADMILQICDELTVSAKDTVMVGDTSMDLEMANNASVESIAVSFGAHSVSELVKHGPLCVIHQFEQIVDLF
jgi:phosphoglycolate phosphatase